MNNDIKELNKLVKDAEDELYKMGVVCNYKTAEKSENLHRIIAKYQQQIVMIKKYGKIL